jgi:Lon protease-like protein
VSETLTLSSLPLFPLGTVLFPDGVLPLRIFEVRYLDMIGKCHKAGAPFGVVTLAQGAEVRQTRRCAEVFTASGTLATITALRPLSPGLMTIRCHGEQRFRISRSRCSSSTACGWPMSAGWRTTSPSRPRRSEGHVGPMPLSVCWNP